MQWLAFLIPRKNLFSPISRTYGHHTISEKGRWRPQKRAAVPKTYCGAEESRNVIMLALKVNLLAYSSATAYIVIIPLASSVKFEVACGSIVKFLDDFSILTQTPQGSTIYGETKNKRMGVAMQSYCVKCRAKREMKQPRRVILKNRRPATQGVCPVCGTKMFRIGGTIPPGPDFKIPKRGKH